MANISINCSVSIDNIRVDKMFVKSIQLDVPALCQLPSARSFNRNWRDRSISCRRRGHIPLLPNPQSTTCNSQFAIRETFLVIPDEMNHGKKYSPQRTRRTQRVVAFFSVSLFSKPFRKIIKSPWFLDICSIGAATARSAHVPKYIKKHIGWHT